MQCPHPRGLKCVLGPYDAWKWGSYIFSNSQILVTHGCSVIHSISSLSHNRSRPLPKWFLHIVQSRASSFRWEYPLLSLRSSNSFLHLLPHLPVTSLPPFIFPSIAYCRRQFLCKMWPVHLSSRLFPCRILLCFLTLSNTSSFLIWSVQLIFSILLQHHISKLLSCSLFWVVLTVHHSFIVSC
jgi:hypothetical protein